MKYDEIDWNEIQTKRHLYQLPCPTQGRQGPVATCLATRRFCEAGHICPNLWMISHLTLGCEHTASPEAPRLNSSCLVLHDSIHKEPQSLKMSDSSPSPRWPARNGTHPSEIYFLQTQNGSGSIGSLCTSVRFWWLHSVMHRRKKREIDMEFALSESTKRKIAHSIPFQTPQPTTPTLVQSHWSNGRTRPQRVKIFL